MGRENATEAFGYNGNAARGTEKGNTATTAAASKECTETESKVKEKEEHESCAKGSKRNADQRREARLRRNGTEIFNDRATG